VKADEPLEKTAEPAPPEEQRPSNPFPIVGIGASAGGLEAFTELLKHLPHEPGLCFLFVQHMEPNRPSLLKDLLSRATSLTVLEATQGTKLECNHLYLLPPDQEMALTDGKLEMTPRPPRRSGYMPADHLFRSLAEVQKSRAIGVILSGGGTDGTLGFKAIKEHGGITFAQDEHSAKQTSMPRSAALDGSVDYVLPPDEIAQHLARIASHSYTAAAAPVAAPTSEEEGMNRIMSLLRSRMDVDFTQYKRNTIYRRIRRRMALCGTESLADYRRMLEDHPAELQSLYQDFLIRVTRFFRDEEVFEVIKGKVFPALIRGRAANQPIRIWVAGCATGEEVYSLAICLLEFLGDQERALPIKILATDLSEAALEKARAGIYIDNIEIDVSPERLRRFFAKINSHYQISKSVRDLCIFSKHNLASDPPFSRLDLVSCRNVLIYLDNSLQRRILPILHYALNPGGFLILGSSESVGSFGDLLTVVDQKHRIYTKNHSTPPGMLLDLGTYLHPAGGALAGAGRPGPLTWTALDVQKEADRVVLNRFAPVGAVVDENLTVLQFRGRTGPYLEPAPGTASLDLLKMVREGLLGEVRAALTRASREGTPVRRTGIPLQEDDVVRKVTVEVVPFKLGASGARFFLVLFEEEAEVSIPRSAPLPPTEEGV
jgi:two-component system CheB/CheR fusion protein